MTGPLLNSAAIIAGTMIGVLLMGRFPERLRDGIPMSFALGAFAIGITMIVKVHFLAVAIMAMILGTALGELFYLEKAVGRLALAMQRFMFRLIPVGTHLSAEEFTVQFCALMVVFTASGLGVVGAMTEGLTGNYELLLVKSMMDFITAIIFAVRLGPSVALIFTTQLLVQTSLYFLAGVISPVLDEVAFADFTAVGGIILVAIGLRLAGIKQFAAINFLPALVLVVPFSYLWRWFGFQ